MVESGSSELQSNINPAKKEEHMTDSELRDAMHLHDLLLVAVAQVEENLAVGMAARRYREELRAGHPSPRIQPTP